MANGGVALLRHRAAGRRQGLNVSFSFLGCCTEPQQVFQEEASALHFIRVQPVLRLEPLV